MSRSDLNCSKESSNLIKEEEMESSSEDTRICPECKNMLHKCLIQQNYAMILCPNTECGYPFNQKENLENIIYVDGLEVLEVATKRLSKE